MDTDFVCAFELEYSRKVDFSRIIIHVILNNLVIHLMLVINLTRYHYCSLFGQHCILDLLYLASIVLLLFLI